MKTIITWLKRAAMLSVTVAFAAAGLGANAATSLTLNDGDTLTGVYEDYEITIAAGATVTFNGATITHTSGNAPAVNCLGDATIILAPGSVNAVTNTVGGYSCVRPAENATLTIRGSGTLTAAGGYNAAAIGSGSGQNGTCGSIVIKGGTIEAFGGTTGAGIGSGNSGTCGDITISGGTVTAEVDRSTSDNMTCTAAIGAGCRGRCGNILISGGTVVADAHSGYSRDDACAIGATYTDGKCGDITLTTGITSLTATKGRTAQQFIGQGDGSATVGRIYGMLRFDKEYSNDGNTVTLTPKASFESYTVTWKNDDGTTADTTSVEYGLLPSHAGLTKAGDGYLEYLFVGWTPEFAEVESNVAYTAVFIAVPAVRSTGGDAEWFVDADEGALRSGVIGDNQNTWLRTSLPRPCVFSFKWKTSSETGCDNLHFTVNGAYVLDTERKQVATISGVGNDWTTVSVVISNSLDVLEWKYGKDGSAVSGQDCGWVKDFEMATFDGEIRSLSVVPNYDGLATVTAYAAKDVVMDVFPPLARHGYALLGYFTAAEGGELVEPPYALSADTTLYAHWAKTTDFDTSDPTAEWTIEDDGITWRTGAIGHSTNTWATYTVKRPCTVTYKWKTSTEANNDPLVFYVDDVEQSRISGESADWVDVSLSFEDSKNHVLKWVYSKDWSDTGRYDCGWIRDFVVTPYDSWAVTRDLNYEGAAEIETRYVKKGSQLDVSEFPPSDEPREGYSCSWAMAPWSGDALSAPVDISADTTLYAHWIKQHGFDEIDTTCQTPWTWIDDGSIRTGKIGDSGETWVTISVTGPCDVSFKWMTSSESGWDKLHFYVDDSHKIEISGVTPEWESYTASVGSGDHVLKWTYTKDGGGAFGEDCGWVKDIVITEPESAPYTVTWKNADGTTLETDADLEAGAVPVYNSALPTQATTAQYTYEFAGWEPEFELVSSNTTYTAKYTATLRSYDVTWQNEDCTPLGATNIFYGATPTYSGATPVKPATPKFTYTFAGWDPEVAAVTGEATYTATYDATINEYTITWKNDDGTVIDSADVAYDETPSHAAPTKASTAQYDYEFAGWSPSVESVIGEATYTATYNSILRSYTITWKNDDGSTIDTTAVNYGVVPTHAAPTKASTAQYDYTFAGWGEVVAVTGEATYQATFTPVLRSYTITWLNDDNSLIGTTTVAYGTTPTHAAPTKAETAEYTYTFAGWSPAIASVSGEATYTAQFNSTKRSYTITWANIDGAGAVATSTVEYGTTPTYGGAMPTKAETAEYTYTFAGWSPAIASVSGEATYTAQFNSTKRSYTITWQNDAGDILYEASVPYGTLPVYRGETPAKEQDDQYIYMFEGWDREEALVTGDAVYTAVFSSSVRRYIVTWQYEDGRVLASGDFEYGTMPEYPGEEPEMPATDEFEYRFIEWSPVIDHVSGDAVYTARFEATKRNYVVSWVVEGMTVATDNVEYGATPTYDGETPTKAADAQYTYEFAGWTPAVAAVTGDATYTAQFNATPKDIPVENVLFSEDFDTASLAPGLTMTVVGSFNSYPGIKAGLGTDDSGAFSFGRSTCGSSAFDNYMTTLTLDFGKETYVTRIEFNEMERYGDWGSQGRILVDGTVVDGLTFTKPGSAGYGNSRVADSEFRHKSLTLNRSLTTISLQVHDITTESEEFIDNLRVYGYGDGTVTVTWRNEDGTILEADKNVALGTMPTYDGATPTKVATAQYSYEFAGWTPAVAAVTGDTVYTATFTPVTRSYTVTWVVEGETVASGTVEYGDTPSYDGETPTKESTAQYDYEFAGWGDVVAVTGDATYMAVFTPVTRSYTVTWVVEGETVASGTVEYGDTPNYDGETPTKESTAEYSYEFSGWSPAISAVTGDATYTAQLNATKRSYMVSWVVEGATVASGTVEYGQTPEYGGDTPTKPETAEYTYIFSGWSPTVSTVTGEATYTAQFNSTKRSYMVSWVVEGVTVASGSVEYGTTPVYNGATPTKPEDENYTYTFNGWTPAVVDVIGNETYTATFTATPKETEDPDVSQELPDYVTTGGSAEWFVEGNDGVEPGAWRSGAIGDSQNTWIETTVTGPCLVSFQWRVSSEEGYDNLHLTVDGEERDPISGSADWDNVSLTFRDAGSHTIRWTYLKDSSVSNGEDCGWVKGFTETPKTFTSYTVTWKNWDGTVLDTDSVLEDDMPEYTAATPTRPKDDEYTYVFNGWSPDIVAATGNVEYTATYTALPNLPASVTTGGDAEWFVDTDGSWRSGTIMNSQETWIETTVTGPCLVTFQWKTSSEGGGYDMLALAVDGEEKDSIGGVMSDWVEYSLPIPESGAHTVRWKYFKDGSAWEGEDCGWVKDFTETPKTFTSYTVTWKNWDGTVLGEDSVVEGFMPQYRGETTARATDEDYYYTFAGWTPDIVAADADAIYTATYNEYQARFEMVMDGTTVTGYIGLLPKHITLADWPVGVTAVADDVFSGYSIGDPWIIESVEIPATVETLGQRAFYNAYGLTNLVFEAGGTQPLEIGLATFAFAYSLESVALPARLASIGGSGFYQCTKLATVTFLGDFDSVEIAQDAFKGTPYYATLPFKMILMEIDGQQTIVSYQGTLPEVLTVADWPAEATAVAGGSLGWNSIVKDITIPSTITSVDAQAFYSSYELTNVVFAVAAPGVDPAPLVIEESAFGECGKLRSVTLRDGLARIVGYAFSGCPLLAEVNFPPSGTDGAYIADSAFAGTEYESHLPFKFYVDESNIVTGFRGECPANIGGEGGVPWPDNISGIGSDAFSGCTTLEHVTFPAGIEAVALGAFRGCGNLASVNFANCFATLTAIGGESFSGCTSLETVELDGDGLYIDSSAFESCTSLTTLTLGSGVSKVDEFAFAYSTSLAAFVNNSSAVIDETAFLGTAYNKNQPFSFITKRQWGELVLAGYRGECPAQITADMWPAGVTYVNRKSFTFCDTLRAVEFPANIGYIDESAFACCTNLASITFPEEGSLHVGHNAFALCTKLQNVTLKSGMEVENDAFGGCASLETVIVEEGVRTIGPGAFARTLVRSIVLPEGIHWVDNMSFAGNDGDFTLYIPRNADDGNYGVSDGTVEYEYYPLIFGLETEAGWARYGFVKRATTTDLHVIPYCRVTLDLAGGSGVATSLLGTGETVNDQFAHPVKSGFTFAGWTSARVAEIATDTTWTAIIGSATGMEATLTALWAPNETPEPPEIVVEDQELQDKLDDPVVDEDTGIRTIKPKDDQTTLTQDDADKIDIKSPLDGTTSIKGAYTMRCDPRLNQIVITLAVPEVEPVAEEENKEAEDATGLLEDVAKVDDEKIAAMPEPDVSDPDPEKHEEVGALPIKMYPGLYYQASWGDDLKNLTSGAKFRADGNQTHIGVIKQTGSCGFYKISVSER